MDLQKPDMQALARQLRLPEGDDGRQVGEMMATNTWDMNAFALQLLDIQPSDHVLEIGYGTGTAIAEAVRLTSKGYVAGIDHSETMLRMAEERNHRAVMQESVELAVGEAGALPYPDESFDKLLAVNVLHFWPDKGAEWTELFRVLKPGGRAVLFVPYPASWPAGLRESGVFLVREPEAVADILRGAGFRSVEKKDVAFGEAKCFALIAGK
jgi:SAM-dependent methyltransferase